MEPQRRLKVLPPPRGDHKYSMHQQLLEDIARYINAQLWILPEPEVPARTTWHEILAHFQLSGYDIRATIEGERQRLAKAIAQGNKSALRWQK